MNHETTAGGGGQQCLQPPAKEVQCLMLRVRPSVHPFIRPSTWVRGAGQPVLPPCSFDPGGRSQRGVGGARGREPASLINE